MTNLLNTTFAKTVAALFLVSTTSLLANPTLPAKPTSFDASVYVTGANKIRIAVAKTTTEPLFITLHQAGESKNDPLFSHHIGKKQTKVALQLDVDQLTDGTYELEIKSATGSIIKQVNLKAVTPVKTTERLLAIQ